jgi:transposase
MLTFVGRRIFLVPGATDMRRSFNGLSGMVRELLSATPESRDLFVFCNAGHNRLKVLVYDESGVWVLAKRLDAGTFAWPRENEAGSVVEYREEQLTLLLRGFDSEELRPRRWHRRAASSSSLIHS